MATLQYNATKSNSYGASAGSADPYFGYQTYDYSLSEGALGNSHVVDILSCSISNANTNGGSSTGLWKMQIEVLLNGTWYPLGYIQVNSQTGTHQTFSNFISTADANIKSLMGKYAPSGIRGKVIEGYFHLNAGSQVVLAATTALDYTPSTLSFTLAGVNAGEANGVNISRMSGDLTHTVDYYFGSEHVQHTGIGTSDSLTVPMSWLNQIPNSVSGTCTCIVTTMYGSAIIGSNTGYFTISAGPGVKPSLASLTPSGIEQYWGLYVQGKSRVHLTANGAAGVYGSFIQGVHIWGPSIDLSSNPVDTGYLQGAGNNVFYATVIDSRGRTSDPVSCTVPVTAYSTPSFVAVDAQRSAQNGDLADEGVYARCTASYSWSAIGSNIINTRVYYRETGSPQSWTLGNAELIPNGGFKVIGGSLAIDKTYDVWFQIWDYFTGGSPIPAYDTIQTAKCVMDWLAGGGGIAFGQVASKPGIEINPGWPLRANGSRIGVPSGSNMLDNGDFIVAQKWNTAMGLTSTTRLVDRWLYYFGSGACHFWQEDITTAERAYGLKGRKKLHLQPRGVFFIYQNLEYDLPPGDYTLSFYAWVPVGVSCYYGILDDLRPIAGNSTWTKYVTSFNDPGYRNRIELIRAVSDMPECSIYLADAKLESGNIETPFSMLPPAEEILRCKRQFQRIHLRHRNLYNSGTTCYPFALPVEMRVTPTVTYSGALAGISLGADSLSPSGGALYVTSQQDEIFDVYLDAERW